MFCRFSFQFRVLLVLILVGSFAGGTVTGQEYFGRNKVRYQKFDFKVMKTDHFDIYYYEEEREAVADAARMAERWYTRLSRVFQHELTNRQPLILYDSHPAFRQTTAIPGQIGESTGGVTEALKRRVVLPMAGPMRETDHVLGHEIVHAFQYDMTGQGQTGMGFEAPGALRLPLWFIEGMAEYLSLGPVDSLTAMWMRDAVRREELPTIEQLEDPRFFPYRYGEALWAYIGGRFGDQVVGRILKSAGRTGDAAGAIERIVGVSAKQLTEDWHTATRDAYEPIIEATLPAADFGRVLISRKKAGEMNVSPSISPDGKWVVFFSEKELFSIDIFLADAETGQIKRKLTSTAIDPHFESLQFINSAGAWSPDSSQVAIGAIGHGRPLLTIIDVQNGDRVKEIKFPELGEIFNPTWSPDGRQVAFSAIQGGLMDLFVVDIQTEKIRRLTNDVFAEIQPDWSPDGRHIAIATDRFTSNVGNLQFGEMGLALVDATNGEVQPLPGVKEGRQTNPRWGRDNSTLYFVSDHNGIPNLYVYRMSGSPFEQVTNLQTGASGISKLSPALSVATGTGRVLFSIFEGGDYNLYVLDEAKASSRQSVARLPGNPALLPPGQRADQRVASLLQAPATGLPRTANFQIAQYEPHLSLDYVSQPTVGVGVSNYGTFIGGGTGLQWSDMLGFHNLMTVFQAGNYGGGNIVNDISALVGYENQRGRWDWGAVGGQVPFVTGEYLQGVTVVDGQEVLAQQVVQFWQIDREIQGQLAYPFSEAQRIEFGGGFRNISFDAEAQTDIFSPITGEFLGTQKEDLPHPDAINLGTASAALVYDTSVFAGTSPVIGQRYRFELEQAGGDLLFTNLLADYRRYFMFLRPLTLAGRFMHYGRYGRDAEDQRMQELYVGYPSLIRGYDFGSFSPNECEPTTAAERTCPVFDQLIGSRIAVANLELRAPLFGPLGLVPSRGFIPIETALFYDAAMAWTSRTGSELGDRDPVRSWGGSLRINLLGFTVAQISLVRPLDRPLKNWTWEFSLTPGF